MAAVDYSQFGLQQDADTGYFKPIEGFGTSGSDTSPEALAAMSDEERRALMLSSMIESQESGNKANLGLLAAQLNEVGSLGAAGEQQITDVFEQERGRSTMSLQARGLGGTTVVGAESAGLAGREARARTQFSESLTRQRLGILGGANFQQPDMGQFYGQMLQAGQAGVGSGAADLPPWYAGPALGGGIDAAGQLLKNYLKDDEDSTGENVVNAVEGVATLADVLTPSPGSVDFSLPDTGQANVVGGYQGIEGGGFQGPSTAGEARLSDAGNAARGSAPDDSSWYSDLGDWASEQWDDIADSAGAVWDATTRSWQSVSGAIASGYQATQTYGLLAASKAGPAVLAAAPWVAAGVAAFLIWRNNKEKIGDLYDDAEEYVKDMYDDTEERTKELASELADNVLAETKRTGDKIAEETKRVIEDVGDFGEDIGKGAKKTVKKVESWIDKQKRKWRI